MTLATLRSRRDTAANWSSANPILSLGEIGVETDTGKGKTGDGASTWSVLPYSLGPIGVGGFGSAVGLRAANCDPDSASGTTTPTAGVCYVSRVIGNTTGSTSNFRMYVNTAGTGLSNVFVATYDATGARLGVSPTAATAFQSTGEKSMTLSPSASLLAGQVFYLLFVIGAGTTIPVLRAVPSGGLPNFNSVNRHNTYLTGQTAAPASLTLGSLVGTTGCPFMSMG